MPEPINPSHLAQEWFHSKEEDTATTSVYRPAGYKFPPARGRMGFEAKADGSLIEKGPGPTDRTQQTPGTWRLVGDTLELIVAGRSTPRVLQIETVEPDRLVVRKATPAVQQNPGSQP